MARLLGPTLRHGITAASAAAVVFTAVVTPLPDRAIADPVPVISADVAVNLTAATRPLLPAPALSALADLSPGQVLAVGQAASSAAVTPTLITTPGLIALADFIDNAYNAIEPWVRYGFEVAAYVVSWIPYVGWIIDDQIWVVYNFVEALINSGVFNVTDWLRGEGSFAKNLADWVADLGLSLVWLAIDEAGAWVPLPPINYPPRAPYFDLPEGLFGDIIVDASDALARVSNGIWNVWEPIKGGIDSGIIWLSSVLDRFERIPFVPLINMEITEAWQLIASGGDALTGFAHDMINAGNQFVFDTVKGGGLITATVNAFNATLDSIRARGSQSIQAFLDWGQAQIDFLRDLITPGASTPVEPDGVLATSRAAGGGTPATTLDDQPPVDLLDEGPDNTIPDQSGDGPESLDNEGVDEPAGTIDDDGEAPLQTEELPEDITSGSEEELEADDTEQAEEPGDTAGEAGGTAEQPGPDAGPAAGDGDDEGEGADAPTDNAPAE